MFEKLVVSTGQRRKHTTARFFLGTSALYVIALALAFAASILMSDPRLADTKVLTHVAQPPSIDGSRPVHHDTQRSHAPASRPDYHNVMTLEHLLSNRDTRPPQIPIIGRDAGDPGLGTYDGPPVFGSNAGLTNGDRNIESPPKPDSPKPKPAARPTTVDNRPVRVTSSMLQGKAIERAKPGYPPLAKQIHLQGDVSVEVMISPEGRVESARVVSGHPIFSQCSREAALLWRFEPTILNGIPVRVTGVITFVFKLTE